MAMRVHAAPAALPRARRDQRRGDRAARRDRSAASASSRPTPPSGAKRSSSRKGAHRLFRNVAQVDDRRLAPVSAVSTVIVGIIGVLMIVVGGRAILAGTMTLGDFVMYVFFTGLVAAPLVSDRVDRHADHRGVRRARSHPRDPRRWRPRTTRTPTRRAARATFAGDVRVRGRELRVQPGRAGAASDVSFHAPPARRPRSSARAGRGRARSSAW